MSGRVLVVGDIVTDVVAVLSGPVRPGSDVPAQVTVAGGGAGGNTAAWLAHQGVPVTLCGVVGADEAGEARLAELVAHRIDLAVRRASGVATGAIVVLAEQGERTFVTDRGANLRLTAGDVDAALAGAVDIGHLHLSGYPLLDTQSRAAARHALAAAADRGLTASVDAASAGPLQQVGGEVFGSWVRGCQLIFANLDEARVLVGTETPSEDLAIRLVRWITAGDLDGLDRRPPVAVVKLGGDGSVAATAGRVVAAPAEPAEVLDATGAGDAFAAGFLRAWLAGSDLEMALRAGAALGARAVRTVGGRPPRPDPP